MSSGLIDVLKLQQKYNQELIEYFQTLYVGDDPMIALRASCIRALAVQGLLSQLDQPFTRTTPSPPFYISLIPIYQFFFPNDNTDTIHLDDGDSPEVKGMWKNLL